MSGGSFGGAPPGQLSIEGSHLVPNSAWFPAVNGGNWPELTDGDVPALWDQLSDAAKYQILMCIFFLEAWGETGAGGNAHYMRPGGKPGFYPPFEGLPHPVRTTPLSCRRWAARLAYIFRISGDGLHRCPSRSCGTRSASRPR